MNSNGNGTGNGRIEGLLERIATTLDGVREEQVRMREEQVRMREDTHDALVDLTVRQERSQDRLREDMNRGFAEVNARIDNVLAIAVATTTITSNASRCSRQPCSVSARAKTSSSRPSPRYPARQGMRDDTTAGSSGVVHEPRIQVLEAAVLGDRSG